MDGIVMGLVTQSIYSYDGIHTDLPTLICIKRQTLIQNGAVLTKRRSK